MPWPPAAVVPDKRTVGEDIPPSNDYGLIVDWINAAKQLQLLDLQEAKQKFLQTNIPMTFVFSDTQPTLTGPEQMWIPLNGAAVDETGYFADRATSTCSTAPPMAVNGSLTLTSGGLSAALAVNKETKTYNGVRLLLTGWTTAPTDLWVGVWATSGELLASTASLAAQATGPGILITGALKTPLALSAGTKVFLGLNAIGGSGLTVARAQFAGAVTGHALIQALMANPIAVQMTGQTAATNTSPPALSFATKVSNVPWVELT